MRNKWLVGLSATLILTAASAGPWKLALPGYRYDFPRDHFSHDDYQMEWWYYTGNLRTADGHRFGFELTFFRQAVEIRDVQTTAHRNTVWRPDQTYLAHLALSDIEGGTFYHTERLNRSGPSLAGADFAQQKFWNGNWHVTWQPGDTGAQHLQAISDRFTLDLDLNPIKPFVIEGENGVSIKGSQPGQASHYISFPRLDARGTLKRNDESLNVSGLAWMDHEFFTEPPDQTLAGWDWFAIQLNNQEELMLYRLRNKAGQIERYSSGTYIDVHGNAHHLDAEQIILSAQYWWRSQQSGANYPVGWRIAIPSLSLTLIERTELKPQELFTPQSVSPGYWEGAVEYEGHIHSAAVSGVGYLEMTGYAAPFHIGG